MPCDDDKNPVIDDAEFVYKETNLVELNSAGIDAAAHYIHRLLECEEYSPRTWRTHPLHLVPPEPYDPGDARTRRCLDWIFFVSALNFSFWSERDEDVRYAVEWRAGWDNPERKVWTGYWSLLAAINRAMEEGIDITNPEFYASESRCPDKLIAHVFRPAPQSAELIPLLNERISILREVGGILTSRFGGSFQGFLAAHSPRTALSLVCAIADTFPSFRDECTVAGRRARFWKRAQILVAEAWAAFFPADARVAHPLYGGIHALTMFADYRVPQILHHLRILAYPPALVRALRERRLLAHGCAEEASIRAASILAVERVREAILRLRADEAPDADAVPSVLIDFYLWDLAKRIESGAQDIEGIQTNLVLPPHRTRSIWY